MLSPTSTVGAPTAGVVLPKMGNSRLALASHDHGHSWRRKVPRTDTESRQEPLSAIAVSARRGAEPASACSAGEFCRLQLRTAPRRAIPLRQPLQAHPDRARHDASGKRWRPGGPADGKAFTTAVDRVASSQAPGVQSERGRAAGPLARREFTVSHGFDIGHWTTRPSRPASP